MVQFDDITVVWGAAPDQLDLAMARWRQAVFQDVAISDDDRFMYFLYDPEADEQSGTSGARKGPPSIVVFDTNARKFVREMHVPLRENQEGVLKFMWQMEGSRSGRAMFIIVTEQRPQYANQPGSRLAFWQVFLSSDGLSLQGSPVPLFGPLPVGQDFIVCARYEEMELLVLTGPGLTVWRIDARQPSVNAVDSFGVSGGDMSRFYDAFTFRDKAYLLASTPDALFDFGYISVLSLTGRSAIQTQPLQRDSVRGFPPARRQAGLDLYQGRVYMCGGEVEQPDGTYFRLQDVWSFDVASFTWHQYPCQIPLPLIEPRLTAGHYGGTLYVWGDCDVPRGCVAPPTHSHIIRMTGAATDAPPAYESVAADTMQQAPPYPGAQGDFYTKQDANQPPYGGSQPGFNPSYDQKNPNAPAGYPPQQGGYPPPGQNQGYPPAGQNQAYPPAGQNQAYPPSGQNQSYPPSGQNQNYPAPQGGSQGYTQQQGGYPPQQQGGYPPQQGGYPPQNQAGYPQAGNQPYPQQGAQGQGQAQGKDKDCSVM